VRRYGFNADGDVGQSIYLMMKDLEGVVACRRRCVVARATEPIATQLSSFDRARQAS